MKKVKLIICLLFTVIMIAGCKKGDTGPAGPAGNANVQASVYTGVFAPVASGVATDEQALLNVSGITQDIVNSGVVLVYYGGTSYPPSSWTALPFSFENGTTGITSGFDVDYGVGTVSITYWESNGADPGNPGTVYFNVVVIAGFALIEHPNVNLKNYEEVKATFKVQELNLNIQQKPKS